MRSIRRKIKGVLSVAETLRLSAAELAAKREQGYLLPIAGGSAEFPYNLNELLGGAARVLYAPIGTTDSAKPADVFLQKSPYTPGTGYVDFGSTKESFTYNRSFETTGQEIQQQTGAVYEAITSNTRQATVSIAGINETNLQIIEQQATAPGTLSVVTGAAPQLAYKETQVGTVTSFVRYRFAFVAMRDQSAGVVNEITPAKARGRFVVFYAAQASVSADQASLELAKGSLAAIPVTFTFFPDSTKTAGEEYGDWWFEPAGTQT
jgi:hypothetical protein